LVVAKFNSGSETGSEPFVDKINSRGLDVVGSLFERPLLETGSRAGDANNKMQSLMMAPMHPADKCPEHASSNVEIVDRPTANRTSYFCILRLAPEKFVSLSAHREDF